MLYAYRCKDVGNKAIKADIIYSSVTLSTKGVSIYLDAPFLEKEGRMCHNFRQDLSI